MKLLVYYNPNAGNKRAKKQLPKVKALFKEKNVEADFFLSERRGHIMEVAAKDDFSKYDGIIAAGGDGTAFEVLNGYMSNPSEKKPPFGVLPVGTGNSFTMELDYAFKDINAAIDLILKNNTMKSDVGHYETPEGAFYFINILGLGFVPEVAKTAVKFKALGNFAYTLGVLYQTIFLKYCNLQIEIDGKNYDQKNLLVEVANTRYTGKDFFIAPKAQIHDGFLDVILAEKMPRRRLIKLFLKIFNGNHLGAAEVTYVQAKEIKITSEKAKSLSPDGEIIGTTPVVIKNIHHAIDIFY